MKLQFGTAALMRITAFVAVAMAGFTIAMKPPMSATGEWLMPSMVFLGPFWVPLVFGAYAVGRKTVNWKCILAFALSEAAAIGGGIWLVS